MPVDRRDFLKGLTLGGAGVCLTGGQAVASATPSSAVDGFGVLVDTTLCVGCRKCEYACQEAAGFPVDPIESFDDASVYSTSRRPLPNAYTVINRAGIPEGKQAQSFIKVNCLHCLEPACASACLVGALKPDENGAVTYDAHKCMGCRYCMVACPFQIPTYEYDNALAPQVRKCTFCADRIKKEGGVPACVKICPREALIFGKRSDLLELAHERISKNAGQYDAHVYGEHEVGGTRWLYLTRQPYEQAGLPLVGDLPPQHVTEAIQHSLFRSWVPPLGFYGLLSLVMWLFGRRTHPTDPVPRPSHHRSPVAARRSRSVEFIEETAGVS